MNYNNYEGAARLPGAAPGCPGPTIKFHLETSKISEAPQAVKILKTMINGKLLFTEDELKKRIEHFNYIMTKNLNRMANEEDK